MAGISLKKASTFHYSFASSSVYDSESASQPAAHRPLKWSEERE